MVLGVDVFEEGLGKEYTLPWGDLSNPERSGTITMTGGLFNYYFLPIAFGWDGAYYEQTVSQSRAYTMTRRIGGPSSPTIVRKSYKKRIVPVSRSGAYDAGQQLYAIDGDSLWNFEITGRITEFRIWVRDIGRKAQLKRTFTFKTATGLSTSSLPVAAGN